MAATASDGDLAAAALAGQQDAFTTLFERHRDPVYRLARGYTQDDEEALDLVQEAFVAAFAGLRRYDPARPFIAWLTRIALNKCHDHARRRRVRSFFARARPIEAAAAIGDDRPGPDTQSADRERLRVLEQAIAALPSSLRDVVILRTIEELSQAETAAALGISAKAVETRLYRARATLAAAMRD